MNRSYTERDPSVLCSDKIQMETCLLFHGLPPPSRQVNDVLRYAKFKYLLLVIRGYFIQVRNTLFMFSHQVLFNGFHLYIYMYIYYLGTPRIHFVEMFMFTCNLFDRYIINACFYIRDIMQK